jgi:hypothetical protein
LLALFGALFFFFAFCAFCFADFLGAFRFFLIIANALSMNS